MLGSVRSLFLKTSWNLIDFKVSSVTRWLFQFFSFYINEKLLKMHPKNVSNVFGQILNKRSKNCRKLLRFCQSGENSPNLVTLDFKPCLRLGYFMLLLFLVCCKPECCWLRLGHMSTGHPNKSH